MRISRQDLDGFSRDIEPAPPPIEPVLSAAEEAKVIATGDPDEPIVRSRRERAQELIRRPAAPEGADAELIALLAAARALPLQRHDDRVRARKRLVQIGRATDPPPEVRGLLERLGLKPGQGAEFADALLPYRGNYGGFGESGAAGDGAGVPSNGPI